MITDTKPAFWAAYEALMPYTRHAQVRAEIANLVVNTLMENQQDEVVDIMRANWPCPWTRINRECLTKVVDAAAAVLTEPAQ